MAQYINYNGETKLRNEKIITIDNRAFRYGDALFETIHATQQNIQLFNLHYERLMQSMKILKMKTPQNFTYDALYKQVISLTMLNNCNKAARVRITVFRKDGGLYSPISLDVNYLIECSEIVDKTYTLNAKGFKIGVYDYIRKPRGTISNLKTTNALTYIMAAIYRDELRFDDCIILNDVDCIVETISSNLFIVRGNNIYTPSLRDGCVAGVMRNKIIEIALNEKYTIFDDCSISEEELLEADEVFLTNAIVGIAWVVAYKHRRYFNKAAKKLIDRLNATLFI